MADSAQLAAARRLLAEVWRVLATWRVTGTMTGPALGQESTGRSFDMTGQHLLRFVDGRVAEEWVAYDTLAMVQQLGLQLPG